MQNLKLQQTKLTDDQVARYAHHIVCKDIGGEGQRKLLSAKVLIVGAGGLGSPAALYLAAAGLGTIGIVDDDIVELSNLQRQIVHAVNDLGKKKVVSAFETISSLNADINVKAYDIRLTKGNAPSIIADYDFIIDGTDNFSSKFLINDTCVKLEKPFSHAGVVGFKGQTLTYTPGSLCMRCVFTEEPLPGTIQDCRGSGIVGAAAGVVGSIQASEAIKYIVGNGDLLTNRMLMIDLLGGQCRNVSLKQNPSCPTCKS